MAKVTVKFHGIMMAREAEWAEEYVVPSGTTVRDVIEMFTKFSGVKYE